MIDTTGKKIVSEEQSGKPKFILAEIRFFINGFRNSSNDQKANNIALCIKNFLNAGGDKSEIKEFLFILERYSEETSSEDFLWELVYIRRLLVKAYDMVFDLPYAAECSHQAAKRFEKICEVAPTHFNHCCRVQEYVSAAIYFIDANKSHLFDKKIEGILDYAEDLFLQIEKSDKAIYYSSGKYLYRIRQQYLLRQQYDRSSMCRIVKELEYFAREVYYREMTTDNLDFWANTYIEYLELGAFSYPDEEENYRKLLNLVDEAVLNGSRKLQDSLDKLKKAFIKYCPDKQ